MVAVLVVMADLGRPQVVQTDVVVKKRQAMARSSDHSVL